MSKNVKNLITPILFIGASLCSAFFFKDSVIKMSDSLVNLFSILCGVVLALQALSVQIFNSLGISNQNDPRCIKFKSLLKYQMLQFFALIIPVLLSALNKTSLVQNAIVECCLSFAFALFLTFGLLISIFVIPRQNYNMILNNINRSSENK